jgi:hypothetical protein
MVLQGAKYIRKGAEVALLQKSHMRNFAVYRGYPDKNQINNLNPTTQSQEITAIKAAENESGIPGKRHAFLVESQDGKIGTAKSYLTNTPLSGSETANLSNGDTITKFKEAHTMSMNNLLIHSEYAPSGSPLEAEILAATANIK